MTYIILMIVCLVLAAASWMISNTLNNPGEKRGARTTALVIVAVAVAITAMFSATTVSARAVGIQTSFGKYQSTLPAGFHVTAPWSGVEEFSTKIQPLELNTAGTNVDVNYKGGGQGDVDVTVRWTINPQDAKALWQKYREFDAVRDQLVKSSTRDSVRVVVGPYAPNDARAGENLRPITDAVVADLERTLADDGILIDSVSITGINLWEKTQASLERVIQAQNDIQVANAKYQQALVEEKTQGVRKRSGLLDPAAQQYRCLDITSQWDQSRSGDLPATWNCLGSQGQTPVIVQPSQK